MNIVAHNKQAWNAQVARGNRWTQRVGAEAVEKARLGYPEIVLTPNRLVPASWLGDLKGKRVLGLASGGGQQGPLLAAAGASVLIVDNSPSQLEQDRRAAQDFGIDLETLEADMADLSALESDTFDLIFHPCSNCFVPDVLPVWREAFRVLRRGGYLLSGLVNPLVFMLDWDENSSEPCLLKFAIPYSDLTSGRPVHPDEPLEFGHSLSQLLGGQMQAGFHLIDLFEDSGHPDPHPLHNLTQAYLATRALKP